MDRSGVPEEAGNRALAAVRHHVEDIATNHPRIGTYVSGLPG